jgi:hypothetical protein
MSITYSIDDLRFKVSESELSETLNTTAFNITTHVTAGDLPDKEYTGDLIKNKGKTYILIDRTTNLRPGYISF